MQIIESIQNRIHELSGENYRTHESTFFRASLGMDEDYKKDKCKTCGWLELDNFFMFFTDEEMFENTAKLFGIFQKKENGIL